MRKVKPAIFLCYVVFYALQGCQKLIVSEQGTVKLTFRNLVADSLMVLNSKQYINPFGEQYNINKFRYYISNVRLLGDGSIAARENNSYHLVDQSDPTSLSFSFELGVNTFSSVEFLLGVDSTRNVSGAQTGALDPLNDMFWTWNSGYVMAKMEGQSPQSTVAGNKVEYHIGGFSGFNNVIKKINLSFPAGQLANIETGQTSEIVINADLDTWWRSPNDIKIADLPICTTPGVASARIAENYSKMFTIKEVTNQ